MFKKWTRCTTIVVFTSNDGKRGPIGSYEFGLTFVINLFANIVVKKIS